MLDYRLLLEHRKQSKVSYRGERMYALGGTEMEASCGVWCIGGTAQGNGDGFFPLDEGRYQRRRALRLSWAGRMFLSGYCMEEREFTKKVDTAEEGGT